MATYSFDDLDFDTAKYSRVDKPFWALNPSKPENDKEVLKWLNGEINFLKKHNEERVRAIRKHIALYKGIQYETQDDKTTLRETANDKKRAIRKVVVNHLYDIAENKVSKLVKYRPAVAILPTNDEHQDKISAKVVKALVDHIWYQTNFDSQTVPEAVRLMFITGESYLFINWDKDKGDLHPDYDADKKQPMLDANGAPVLDSMGNPVVIEDAVHIGDVSYELEMPDNMFLQTARQYSDVNYCFRRRVKHVEELRAMYPDKADQIKATQDVEAYDYQRNTMEKLKGEVVYYEFYHRKGKYLDKGRRVVFTQDVILENSELPYSHGELPFERLTDMDIPGEPYGRSFFEQIKGLTGVYNNLVNLIWRNQVLVAHPKWMMPAGACDISSLGNDVTIVQYKGPAAPQLVQANPTPSEMFGFMEKLKSEFEQISGVFGVSRGEPPQGIKAGIALQFLAEQESERYNSAILKFNEWVKQVALKTIAVAADYYDTSDQRMLRLMGKNNEWQLKFFDAAVLSKSYDVRVQNSSALPQSKAARTQYLLDIKQQFPTAIDDAQFLDMLDLAQNEKFIDVAAVAVRTAEAEVEDLLAGEDVPEPEEYEDLITKWKVYARTPQSYTFKRDLEPEIRQKFLDYMAAVEYLMIEKSKKNDAFAELLAQLPNFPLVFEPQMRAVQGDIAPEEMEAPPQEPMQSQEAMPMPVQGAEPGAEVMPEMPPVDQQMAAELAVTPAMEAITPTSAQ